VPAEVLAKFPHLAGLTALRLPAESFDMVPGMLRAQIAVSRSSAGSVVDATGVQAPGVIDDLYAAAALTAPVGVTWSGTVPTVGVWAPTARRVSLQRFTDSTSPAIETLAMERDAASGVWSVTGSPEWNGQYYLFEVEAYAPSAGQVVTNLVTDPYSVSLSMNSTRSQVVDLNDPALAPPGWNALVKPAVADPVDIVVYELHVRDFSAADPTVPEELVGTYRAFTLPDTNGVNHLRSLAEAGLTHLHLLPTFDIATIDEDRSTWLEPTMDFELPNTGPGPQEAVAAVRDQDAFNWGYDPYHYNVPEGSYAAEPDGTARIVEYRQMVMALWDLGLRVVVDVVYNHTNAAGQAQRSVLDRIVPGYYHRLDEAGNVTTSTCCANTATEHAMMERLMVDSVRLWAEQYKVDAFRFDLMGHHMVENMAAVRAGLDALTIEANGVDGAGIYVYGEGWDFGEVAQNGRGANATQANMAGTGIGTFNDRLRDAVRGGGPFDGAGAIVGNQGFASGRYVLPNATTAGYDRESERFGMLHAADQVRVGLAGNLAAFTFVDAGGNLVSGADVDYNGQSAGYGAVPQDHIVYVSKHDNQTLWDILAYKLPSDLPTADRVRLQNLALSTVAFAQGVPFFHAGSDLLRSKSLDRNSYDAGDWFNAIDWPGGAATEGGAAGAGRGNGLGRGLPLAGDNQELWSLMRPMLANPLLQPTPDDVAFSAAVFREWLTIRRDEPLLRLRTAQEIEERLSFFNTGPDQ
ncbi:MAG TPA: pullulanase-type alpha-1,6-glucosidase, partial [Trueperaceae bacterium]|nr:pullulanase-type alpha-1,6-glucosidase [Trueperaceae bacterium]